MAVGSVSDSCRKCGGEMERGSVRGEAGRGSGLPATILWEPARAVTESIGRSGNLRLAKLPIGMFRESPVFPALLCRSCRLVELQYTRAVPQSFL